MKWADGGELYAGVCFHELSSYGGREAVGRGVAHSSLSVRQRLFW